MYRRFPLVPIKMSDLEITGDYRIDALLRRWTPLISGRHYIDGEQMLLERDRTLIITAGDSRGLEIWNRLSPIIGRARSHSSERDIHRDIYSLQAFSSDSSLQSGLPLQKSSLSTHSPLPHDNFPSGQTGSSVFRMGKTLRGSAKRDCR